MKAIAKPVIENIPGELIALKPVDGLALGTTDRGGEADQSSLQPLHRGQIKQYRP